MHSLTAMPNHPKNKRQIAEYERDFLAGRLPGQAHPPRYRWCRCVDFYAEPTPKANTKCAICHGKGHVLNDKQ